MKIWDKNCSSAWYDATCNWIRLLIVTKGTAISLSDHFSFYILPLFSLLFPLVTFCCRFTWLVFFHFVLSFLSPILDSPWFPVYFPFLLPFFTFHLSTSACSKINPFLLWIQKYFWYSQVPPASHTSVLWLRQFIFNSTYCFGVVVFT